ncbi:MAG: 2,3-bisphosphoglycerate-independent phosphoglycerate mutase, partial [Gammaproteobacteria bacterium]
HRPYVLIVLDGWGYSENTLFNAIHSAQKPVWDRLWRDCPHTLVSASGTDVGLPDAQMGNSEVGHMNIGSGRIVNQDFTRIMQSIEDGEFDRNEVLVPAFNRAADNGKALHIMGLLSSGGVHSHQDHIFALMDLAAQCGLKAIYLHAFLDGRDTPPKSAEEFLYDAQVKMRELGLGRFASVTGRYYAMDRNKSWDRTRLAYDLIVDGKAEYQAADPFIAVDQAYARDESDEFVRPTAIVPRGEEPVTINDGDVVMFANYRADRARQLAQAFTDPGFEHFERTRVPELQDFISMTRYKDDFNFPAAFPPEQLKNVLGEYIADLGLRQLRIAETEKYAHVTFFFNGGEEKVFKNEDRILVPSPHVATYDLKPEMSAIEVTDKLVDAIKSNKYDVIICNYANPDMVGHTGNFDAAVRAIECIDECLGKLVEATNTTGGELLITADHGNAEQMRSYITEKVKAQAHTAHTLNLVPFVYVGRDAQALPGTGALCDIAPTLLYLMGLEQPVEMTGRSLFDLEQAQSKAVGGN